MSDTVIKVENLSKHYRLGLIGGRTLRDDLNRWWAKFLNKPDPLLKIGQEHLADRYGEYIWALRDINFEVKQGEVLGIIGRNGAGKSTLLKILSRITSPTSGVIKIKGRIASLLEVGTGFHPDLTGRENVYLNGAILGMTKTEVDRKFDEIVDFSGVEQFIDTPAKRYSSGMNVRLAFAVAAHLEPEILIIDEVLAVGDVAFQKKCVGKMNDVARQGRTILFVSHTMEIIHRLCERVLLFHLGRLDLASNPRIAIERYLQNSVSRESVQSFSHRRHESSKRGSMILINARLDKSDTHPWSISCGNTIGFIFGLQVLKPVNYAEIGVGLFSATGMELVSSLSSHTKPLLNLAPGSYEITLQYPELILVPGQYVIGVGIRSEYGKEDYIPEAFRFEIEPSDNSARMNMDSFRGFVVTPVEVDLKLIV